MNKVKKILIVTADACHAQFYLANGPQNITKLSRVENPLARLHERDLTTKSHDVNTCPYEGSIKKQHEELMFAKYLAERIQILLTNENINEVCLFSSHKFLGMLRNERFGRNVRLTSVAKDFMHSEKDLATIQRAITDVGLSFLPADY